MGPTARPMRTRGRVSKRRDTDILGHSPAVSARALRREASTDKWAVIRTQVDTCLGTGTGTGTGTGGTSRPARIRGRVLVRYVSIVQVMKLRFK